MVGGRLYVSLVARTLPTSWRVAGRRFFEPGGRPGPGRDGLGALAGEPVYVHRFLNPLRARAGVSLLGGAGFSRAAGNRWSAAARTGAGHRRRSPARSTGQQPPSCGDGARSTLVSATTGRNCAPERSGGRKDCQQRSTSALVAAGPRPPQRALDTF